MRNNTEFPTCTRTRAHTPSRSLSLSLSLSLLTVHNISKKWRILVMNGPVPERTTAAAAAATHVATPEHIMQPQKNTPKLPRCKPPEASRQKWTHYIIKSQNAAAVLRAHSRERERERESARERERLGLLKVASRVKNGRLAEVSVWSPPPHTHTHPDAPQRHQSIRCVVNYHQNVRGRQEYDTSGCHRVTTLMSCPRLTFHTSSHHRHTHTHTLKTCLQSVWKQSKVFSFLSQWSLQTFGVHPLSADLPIGKYTSEDETSDLSGQ